MEGCVDLVNVRADDIDKRKSTRCLAHLKICKASAAAQDPRVCGKRKARAPTAEPEPSETRLTRREEELELRNDTLQQQNCSTRAELDDVRRQMRVFEEQMERMQRQVDDGDRERERLQRQVDKGDRDIFARALGFETPPVPPVEDVLECVQGIQKSAAVQAAFGVSGASDLKKEHDRLKRIVEDKESDLNRGRRRFAERVQEADRKYAMQNELFDPLKDLFFDKSSAAAARAQRMSKFLKTLLVTAHSDKNPGNPEESEMMTKVITAMRRRLRSESRSVCGVVHKSTPPSPPTAPVGCAGCAGSDSTLVRNRLVVAPRHGNLPRRSAAAVPNVEDRRSCQLYAAMTTADCTGDITDEAAFAARRATRSARSPTDEWRAVRNRRAEARCKSTANRRLRSSTCGGRAFLT